MIHEQTQNVCLHSFLHLDKLNLAYTNINDEES
jgi:hypothetical protein